jgi:hypothetical protein
MIWRWNKPLLCWESSDGHGGAWRIYPFRSDNESRAAVDHFVKDQAWVRVEVFRPVGLLGAVQVAESEVEKRQVRLDKRLGASPSVL